MVLYLFMQTQLASGDITAQLKEEYMRYFSNAEIIDDFEHKIGI